MARITYLFVLATAICLAVLPLGWALAFGRGAGSFAYYVIGLRRRVVIANLRHVIGESRGEAEVQRIAPETYRQFAMTLVEVLRSSAPIGGGLSRNVTFGDLTELRAIRDAKRPAICVQGHTGNFDLTAYAFAGLGFPHHTVMRTIKNRYVNRLIVGVREKHGITVHQKGAATTRDIRAALKRDEWIGVLPDQNAKERGVVVDYLGKPASLYKGAATFHLETGAPLIVAVGVRSTEDPRKHHVGFEILPVHAPTDDEEADVRAVMQSIADALSRKILLHPEQYFFMHRLWGKAMHEAPELEAQAA